MTVRDFYRRALLLPLVVPILAWVVIYVDAVTGVLSGKGVWVIGVAMVLGFGGLWGAIPYTIVALALLRVLRTKSVVPKMLSVIVLLTPIAVIITAAFLVILLSLVTGDFTYWKTLYFYSLWAAIIGYVYVLTVAVLFNRGIRMGWVTQSE